MELHHQATTGSLKYGVILLQALNEFIKASIHQGEQPQAYFWQDSQGKEIDCLLVDGEKALPIEIKSGKTIDKSYFANLRYWRELAGMPDDYGDVIYGGDQTMKTSFGNFLSWRDVDTLATKGV